MSNRIMELVSELVYSAKELRGDMMDRYRAVNAEVARVDIEVQALKADIGRYVKIVGEKLAAIEAQHVDCRTCGAFSHCYNVVVDPECDAGSKYQAEKITQLYEVTK